MTTPPDASAPHCVGIIMDGNRRFARAKGIPLLEGHRAGAEKLKEVAMWAKDAKVHTLICYAFSTENWHRDPEEVEYLMKLLSHYLSHDINEILEQGCRLRVIGERERLSDDAHRAIETLEARTKGYTDRTLVFALSYGGRADILQAARALAERGEDIIDEESFSRALWTRDIPDPDMIIRTGGERRLSNFLTWNSVYSELFFTDTLWPEFSKEEFLAMLTAYGTRERRRGR